MEFCDPTDLPWVLPVSLTGSPEMIQTFLPFRGLSSDIDITGADFCLVTSIMNEKFHLYNNQTL